jgi:hypothetical protein
LLTAFEILYKTRAAGKRILAEKATQSRQKVAVFALSNFIFRLFFWYFTSVLYLFAFLEDENSAFFLSPKTAFSG